LRSADINPESSGMLRRGWKVILNQEFGALNFRE
jgi:hypothetical protein